MSAQTPPTDGFGAYLRAISDTGDEELPPITPRPYSALFDFYDPPEPGDDEMDVDFCPICGCPVEDCACRYYEAAHQLT